jgi:hypothetical protein
MHFNCGICNEATKVGVHICVDCYEFQEVVTTLLAGCCTMLKMRHPKDTEVEHLNIVETRPLLEGAQ